MCLYVQSLIGFLVRSCVCVCACVCSLSTSAAGGESKQSENIFKCLYKVGNPLANRFEVTF